MSRLSATTAALRSRTGLRRVLLAYCLFDFTESFVWLVLILWAFGVGGAALAGLAALAQLVPAALLAPAIAAYGDRMSRGTALVVAYAALGVACLTTLVALLLDWPVWAVVLTATAGTTVMAVVRSIHFAALPQLSATPDELVSANSWSSVADGTFRFLGPVAAGVVVVTLGYWQAFWIATVLCLVGSLLSTRLALLSPVPSEDEVGGLQAALGGIRALWGDWGSLALLVVLAVDFVMAGALDILGVAYAQAVLGIEATGAGLIIGSLGIGGLVGAFIGASLARGRRLAPVIVMGAMIEGTAFALMAFVGRLTPAMVLLGTAGAAGAVMIVSGRTLLQRSTDDRVLARVFAVQESTHLLGVSLGAVTVPLVLDRFSPSGAWVPYGLASVTVAGLGAVFIQRLDARSVYRPVETSLLRGVGFLSVLPEYDLERLAKNAHWESVDAGVTVIRQGDPGRGFYVIGGGEFSVTVDGELRPFTLEAGAGFGEIALLHDVPRTATITALSPGRLLVVEKVDFLAAVSGNADGQALAAEVSAVHLERDRR